jgi:hypothetical protein
MLDKLKNYVGDIIAGYLVHDTAMRICKMLYSRKYEVEHLYGIDMKGRVLFHAVGDDSSVKAPDGMADYAMEKDYVMVHNHPGDSFCVPSEKDLECLLNGWVSAGYTVDDFGIVCKFSVNWTYYTENDLSFDDYFEHIRKASKLADDMFDDLQNYTEEEAFEKYGILCANSLLWWYLVLIEYFDKYPIFNVSIITTL